MSTETTMYKDSTVVLRYGHAGPQSRRHLCWCCREAIENRAYVLLINNYRYLPNILFHRDCLEKRKDSLDGLFGEIEDSYEQYRHLKEIFDPE